MRNNKKKFVKYILRPLRILLFLLCALPSLAAASDEGAVLKTGWFPFDPYMEFEDIDGLKRLKGLDIKMIEALAKHLDLVPDFTLLPWDKFLKEIKSGEKQIAPFATKTKGRSQWAYFSDPYRWEENALYVHYGSTFEFSGVGDFIKKVKKTGFILGVMDGFVYASDIINEFINDPKYAKQIVKVKFESDNLNNLLANKIDGFLTDRLVGATMILNTGERQKVEERLLGISTPIHFLISKKSETPEFVLRVNQILKQMRASGEHRAIIQEYVLPILIMQTVDRPWFIWIETLAIIAFVLSGTMLAAQEDFPLSAGLGLAIIPTFGGEVARDVILDQFPIGILTTPRYIFIVLSTFAAILLFINLYDIFRYRYDDRWLQKLPLKKEKMETLIFSFDALGTSAFTIIGVLVAVTAKAEPLWVWGPLFAVLTGVGGGTIRNILMGYRAFGSPYIYAEIPLVCGLGFSVFLSRQVEKINANAIFMAVILTVAAGCLLHFFVYYYRIPSIRIHFAESMFKRRNK